MKIRIEGPYYGSYSLARINRQLALSLSTVSDVSVSISATGAESWHRDEVAEQQLACAGVSYEDARSDFVPDVVVRHTWPIEASNLKGKINLRLFPWEETRIPGPFIDQFNAAFDAMLAPSEFVRKTLLNCGLRVDVEILENAADIGKGLPKKSFSSGACHFLHISSCFPRKGVDVLIDAFAEEFCGDRSAELTIKSFWNPHNESEGHIKRAREIYGVNLPKIKLISEDYTDEALTALIDDHDFMVLPSRGEGFGLPAVEAHLRCKPCIMPRTTALGERFIDGVDFEIDSHPALAASHVTELGSLWFEPDKESLKRQLRAAADLLQHKKEEYQRRSERLHKLDYKNWQSISKELIGIAKAKLKKKETYTAPHAKPRRLILISSFAQVCGIATYSENLLPSLSSDEFQDVLILAPVIDECREGRAPPNPLKGNIHRCWSYWGDIINEIKKVYTPRPGDCIAIQHHTGFFSPRQLQMLIDWFSEAGARGSVTLHSVLDNNFAAEYGTYKEVVGSLPRQFVTLVHSLPEYTHLNSERVILFPHPFQKHLGFADFRPPEGTGIVSSFGFMRRHKGYRELISVWPRVLERCPETKLILLAALHPASDSQQELEHCRWLVEEYGLSKHVTIISDFLDDADIQAVLGYSDLVLFPYGNNCEGASGAVRIALSSHAAVCTSDIPLFAEFGDAVSRFRADADSLEDKVTNLLNDQRKTEKLRERAEQLSSKNSYLTAASWMKNLLINHQ